MAGAKVGNNSNMRRGFAYLINGIEKQKRFPICDEYATGYAQGTMVCRGRVK